MTPDAKVAFSFLTYPLLSMEPVQKSDPKPTRSGIETLLSLPESMQLPPPDPTTPEHAAVIFSVSENPGYAALGFSRIIAIGAPVASCGRAAAGSIFL